MPFFQDVSLGEIDEAMRLLSEDNARLSLTVCHKGRWVTFRTCVIAGQGDTVWVDLPKTDHLPGIYTFPNGEQLGVCFALKLLYSLRIRKI